MTGSFQKHKNLFPIFSSVDSLLRGLSPSILTGRSLLSGMIFLSGSSSTCLWIKQPLRKKP